MQHDVLQRTTVTVRQHEPVAIPVRFWFRRRILHQFTKPSRVLHQFTNQSQLHHYNSGGGGGDSLRMGCSCNSCRSDVVKCMLCDEGGGGGGGVGDDGGGGGGG